MLRSLPRKRKSYCWGLSRSDPRADAGIWRRGFRESNSQTDICRWCSFHTTLLRRRRSSIRPFAYALEEGGEIDAFPLQSESQTELVTRSRVADDCTVVAVDFPVRHTVRSGDVFVFDVAWSHVGFVAAIHRRCVNLFARREVSVGYISVPRTVRLALGGQCGSAFIFFAVKVDHFVFTSEMFPLCSSQHCQFCLAMRLRIPNRCFSSNRRSPKERSFLRIEARELLQHFVDVAHVIVETTAQSVFQKSVVDADVELV